MNELVEQIEAAVWEYGNDSICLTEISRSERVNIDDLKKAIYQRDNMYITEENLVNIKDYD